MPQGSNTFEPNHELLFTHIVSHACSSLAAPLRTRRSQKQTRKTKPPSPKGPSFLSLKNLYSSRQLACSPALWPSRRLGRATRPKGRGRKAEPKVPLISISLQPWLSGAHQGHVHVFPVAFAHHSEGAIILLQISIRLMGICICPSCSY